MPTKKKKGKRHSPTEAAANYLKKIIDFQLSADDLVYFKWIGIATRMKLSMKTVYNYWKLYGLPVRHICENRPSMPFMLESEYMEWLKDPELRAELRPLRDENEEKPKAEWDDEEGSQK